MFLLFGFGHGWFSLCHGHSISGMSEQGLWLGMHILLSGVGSKAAYLSFSAFR